MRRARTKAAGSLQPTAMTLHQLPALQPVGSTKTEVKAEIVHGKLAVTVADTGLGFGRAASSRKTAGTGVGLANIRERLQLLYGNKAALTITENPGGGTRVVLAVPYKPLGGAA